MLFRFLRVFVRYIQVFKTVAVNFHFVVNGPRYNITGSQGAAAIIFLHKFPSVAATKYGTVTANGFGDEKYRFVARMIECCGVKLHKFHIFYSSTGTVNHGYAVAGSNGGIGGCLIHAAYSACSQHCHFRQEGVNVVALLIEGIHPVTFDVGCVLGYNFAQVMLCENFNGKIMLVQLNFGMIAYLFVQAFLNDKSGIILVVQNTKFGMPAFLMQVEL